MRKKAFFVFLLLFIPVLGWSVNFKELPQYPGDKNGNLFWFYTSNDGLGYELGEDWDDLRTFGFLGGAYFLDRFLVTADYHCFTDRNLSENDSTRIDEIKMLGGVNLVTIDNEILYGSLFAGAGGFFYGDFGSTPIQEDFHKFGAGTRAVTHKYDIDQNLGFGFLHLDLMDTLGLNMNLKSYAHLTTGGDLNLDFTLGRWFPKEISRFYYSASYKVNRSVSLNSTAASIYNSEQGFWLTSLAMVGPIYLERGINLTSLTPHGAVGFRFSPGTVNSESDGRYEYSFGWLFGQISNIEKLKVTPDFFIPNLDGFMRLQNIEDLDVETLKMVRLHVATAGVEYFLFDREKAEFPFFNLSFFAGGGFVRERRITHDMLHVRILDENVLSVIHWGSTARFQIPAFFLEKEGLHLGMELEWNMRIAFSEHTLYKNPDVSLGYGFYISER